MAQLIVLLAFFVLTTNSIRGQDLDITSEPTIFDEFLDDPFEDSQSSQLSQDEIPEIISSFIPFSWTRGGFNQTTTCGQTRGAIPVSRIVGGRKSLDGEFPWQVSLQLKRYSGKYIHFCGASVLNDRWIVTAAHCLQGQRLSSLRGMMGANSLSASDATYVKFSRMIIHERFSLSTIQNDIGLLKTSTAIPLFTSSGNSEKDINSVCLPPVGYSPSGTGSISGFGSTKEGGSSSDVLLATDIDFLPNQTCQNVYAQYKPDSMLCAGVTAGGKDTCQGDSGGPLVQRRGAGSAQSQLVGLTSFGRGCARPGTPGVYTRVSNYVDWINKNAN